MGGWDSLRTIFGAPRVPRDRYGVAGKGPEVPVEVGHTAHWLELVNILIYSGTAAVIAICCALLSLPSCFDP